MIRTLWMGGAWVTLEGTDMLFFITGASGSGKSACLPSLRLLLPEIRIYEFDSVGVPDGADTAWRQRTAEYWVRKVLGHQQDGIDTLVAGHAQYGELLACPSANQLDRVAACLLDCADVVRIDRIRGRDGHSQWASMEMLCWAAWQRMHAVDPQWRPDVIQNGGDPSMRWERWSAWQRGDPRWQVWTLDTTYLTVGEVAQKIADWVLAARPGRGGSF